MDIRKLFRLTFFFISVFVGAISSTASMFESEIIDNGEFASR